MVYLTLFYLWCRNGLSRDEKKGETTGSAVASAIGFGVSLIGVGWLVGAGISYLGSKASELASPFLLTQCRCYMINFKIFAFDCWYCCGRRF